MSVNPNDPQYQQQQLQQQQVYGQQQPQQVYGQQQPQQVYGQQYPQQVYGQQQPQQVYGQQQPQQFYGQQQPQQVYGQQQPQQVYQQQQPYGQAQQYLNQNNPIQDNFLNADKNSDFSTSEDRLNFIKKVYGIVSCMMTITAIFVAASVYIPGYERIFYTSAGSALLMVAVISYFVIYCTILCNRRLAREVPTNYILLTGFTLATSLMVSTVTTYYDPMTVFLAMAATAGLTIALTIYAFRTKTDFTILAGLGIVFVFAILWGLMLLAFVASITGTYALVNIVVIAIYGLVLVIDTQWIIGGKHRYQISQEDYVFAALIIYLDIIYLFLEILKMFGRK